MNNCCDPIKMSIRKPYPYKALQAHYKTNTSSFKQSMMNFENNTLGINQITTNSTRITFNQFPRTQKTSINQLLSKRRTKRKTSKLIALKKCKNKSKNNYKQLRVNSKTIDHRWKPTENHYKAKLNKQKLLKKRSKN